MGESFQAVAFPGDAAGEFQRRRRNGSFPSGGVVRRVCTTLGMTWSPNMVIFGSDQMKGWRRLPTTNFPATQRNIQPHEHS